MRRIALTSTVTTVLSALVLSFTPAASAVPVNGCDLEVDDESAACQSFDSDGDGRINPYIEIAWPDAQGIQAGSSMTVSAQGSDLLRPVTVGIFRDETPEPVASVTVGPGSLTASVTVPTGAAGPAEFTAEADDDDAWLYVYDTFEPTISALPSSLSSDLPPGRIVKSGANTQPATGTVSGGARPVHLQVKTKDGSWVAVAETTSTADGAYTLGVPSVWVGNHTYRAHAPAYGPFAAVDDGKTGTVNVKRTYKPRGSKAHKFMFGPHARWNACAPIRYALNTSRMPKWGPAEVRYALREATAATGLRFTAVGTTDYVPFNKSRDSHLDHPANVDLVFAWSTPKTVPRLGGNTVGLGGANITGTTLFNGGVTLDVAAKNSKKVWREVMLHEVGHALGLTHVSDRTQVMVSGATGKNTRYNKGDLTGLSALGAGAGACTPEAPEYLTGNGRRSALGAEARQVVMP